MIDKHGRGPHNAMQKRAIEVKLNPVHASNSIPRLFCEWKKNVLVFIGVRLIEHILILVGSFDGRPPHEKEIQIKQKFE